MRFLMIHRPVALVAGCCAMTVMTMQPVLADGNLTLPFADPNPRITSWMDHHYPTRQQDGIMIRFDGATGYAYDGHRGTDFAVPSNTPVVAADDGTVIYSEWSDSGGWGVVIDHAFDRTAYFHNNQLFVYPGQHVSRGQLIALSGSTGNSTGPHVHFEVRDLLVPWHSVDPYGWTGPGKDPWRWDMGYLWTSNPPVPFLLPLAFPGGARWNYWYGADGPPPPVTWQLRDGGRRVAGYAARWDADPGASAPRTLSTSGTAAVPGPGSHTLHLRVFDRAGTSADLTYLYLYDVDPPTSELHVDPARSTAMNLHWTASDSLSGVKDVAVDVAVGSSAYRPWLSQSADQPKEGTRLGATRFFGDPGTDYQFRLTVKDAARNAATPVVLKASAPAGAGVPATAADENILGPLPDQPDGAPTVTGIRQEHPSAAGAVVLGTDASIHGLAGDRTSASGPPASAAPAVDVATLSSGLLRLLADGTTWTSTGAAGPRFAVGSPVRLLAASDGALMAVAADGTISISPTPSAGGQAASPSPSGGGQGGGSVSLPEGASVVDAALFPGTHSGLVLDSTGAVHAFGGADAAVPVTPSSWTLPDQPAAITLAGTAQSPAGLLTDASGDWQVFGSLLWLTDATFGGPVFDPTTGLPIH
jgi:hypothetical protein